MTKLEKEMLESFRYNPKTGVLIRIRDKNRWGYFVVNEISGTSSLGYIRSVFQGKSFGNPRIAFLMKTGKLPAKGIDIDHINGIKDDNRWCNLRLATRGQNNMNSGNPANNTTGQKGVHPTRGRWFARIKVDQKIIHLGVFKTFDLAVQARKKAETEYFGEFKKESLLCK